MAGGSRFRVTPAAAPEQPEIKQLQNALLVPPPLPNLSSDQLPKDTHQVSGLSGSVSALPPLLFGTSSARNDLKTATRRPFRGHFTQNRR